MNCPKCGKEMKLGAILGSQRIGIRWVPQNAIVGSYFVITKKAVERDGGFFLTENGAEYDGYMHPVASYVCCSCGLGIYEFTPRENIE